MYVLKPCPFCGCKPCARVNVSTWSSDAAKTTFQIRCECGICKTEVLNIHETDFDEITNAMQSVVNKWNCRSME